MFGINMYSLSDLPNKVTYCTWRTRMVFNGISSNMAILVATNGNDILLRNSREYNDKAVSEVILILNLFVEYNQR